MQTLGATPVTVFILTRDRAVSRPFYDLVLGLNQRSDGEYSTVYDLNGGEMHLTTVADHKASVHPVLGWAVTDIRQTALDLVQRGVSFTRYDGYGQDDLGIWSSPDGSSKMCWFADPDGNVLSLSQG